MNSHLKPAKLTTKVLRQRAEAKLKKQTVIQQTPPNYHNTKKMLHELQVHQIELEMQNEELKQARITERLYYRYTELFEFAPIAYFAFDLNGIINQVNLRGASLLGIDRTNLVGKQFSNYVTVQYRDIFKRCLAEAFGGGGIQSCEVLGQVGNNALWLDIEINMGITGKDCLVVVIDITARKQAQDNQKFANEEKEKRAVELILANEEKKKRADELVLANKELAFQNEEKDKRADELILANEEKEKRADALILANKELAFQNKEKDKRADELILANEEKQKRADELVLADIELAFQQKEKDKRADELVINKEHQDQLEHIAHYDVLTNLPNRVLLADRLSQAMLQCNRHEQSLAVVFLDLDGFKAVNDAYGHDLGDELLIALSVRMKEALREGDSLARIGGDEFVSVLTDLTVVEDCEPVLERFLLAASEPITVGDVILNVSASIGVTLYPQDNVDADQLMRHADQAMYVAKQSGKNCYHLFDTAQDDAVKVQRESLEAIRRALDKQEFVLHYQPNVNMRTGKVIGFEALIRWQHPERGLLNPIDFLPVIENNPMSIEMGEWVIDTALSQISQWQTMGLKLPVNTSVNIAAVQLQQANFLDRLTTLLAAHPDVEPRYLELEVLETSALEDVQNVSTMMNACMALGVSFAIDDFGTGYSSLTYLRRLPASLIKIDQTFVRDMLNDVDDLAIVEGVIALAKSFKRDVIAEGVETIEHGTALLKLGCDLAQGYGIARAMPASDIPAWIKDWKPDVSWQT